MRSIWSDMILCTLEVKNNIQVPQCSEPKTPGRSGPHVILMKTGHCGENQPPYLCRSWLSTGKGKA